MFMPRGVSKGQNLVQPLRTEFVFFLIALMKPAKVDKVDSSATLITATAAK